MGSEHWYPPQATNSEAALVFFALELLPMARKPVKTLIWIYQWQIRRHKCLGQKMTVWSRMEGPPNLQQFQVSITLLPLYWERTL